MQRVPSNNVIIRGALGANERRPGASAASTGKQSDTSTASPLYTVARRVFEEQGREQLCAFLEAMTPFAAPNELKKIGASFGADYDEILKKSADKRAEAAKTEAERQTARQQTQPAQAQQLRMLQQIMALQNLFGSGKQDTSSFMNAMSALAGRT